MHVVVEVKGRRKNSLTYSFNHLTEEAFSLGLEAVTYLDVEFSESDKPLDFQSSAGLEVIQDF